MIKAMTVLLPHLWECDVQRIVAVIDPRDDGSIRILKRDDFVGTERKEKTRKVDEV